MSQHLTSGAKETKRLGEYFAKKVLNLSKKGSIVIGLKGELGGGKTTFIQGFAEGLGIKKKVLSPTFVIFRRYNIKGGSFYHFDCYRLERKKDLNDLGFEDIIKEKGNIIALEWADKIKDIKNEIIWVNFSFEDKNKRKIEINL
jgi:tRNA threonylcarbamoyladenosine biosynthesis protein TsaE